MVTEEAVINDSESVSAITRGSAEALSVSEGTHQL